MAVTNQDRVGKAMDLLRQGLAPFVEREVQEKVRIGAVNMDTVRRFSEDPTLAKKPIAVVLMRLLFRLEAVGRELVPATGPVLIVSNHVSVLDPPLVGGSVPRPVYFMAKAELFRIPLFGRLIRSAQRAAGAAGRLGHAGPQGRRCALLRKAARCWCFPRAPGGRRASRRGRAGRGDAGGAERRAGGAGLRVGERRGAAEGAGVAAARQGAGDLRARR